MTSIFVIGMYRTGTNYFQQLVNLNFVNNEGVQKKYEILGTTYKHCLHDKWLKTIPTELTPVMVYKLPVKWIESIQRKSYDLTIYYDIAYERGHTPIELTFCDPNNDEEHLYTTRFIGSVEKLCWLYNRYFDYWFNQQRYKLLMINHKYLAKNNKKVLLLLENTYCLKRRYSVFEDVKLGEVVGSRPFDANVKQYYELDYSTQLSNKQIKTIQSNIDLNIWKSLEKDWGFSK